MGLFDRFKSPERLQAEKLAHLERDEQCKRVEFETRARERALEASSRWTYEEFADEMRGTSNAIATLASTNTVTFDFPYHGGSQAFIMVRSSGRSREAMISVPNGQFDPDLTNFQIGTYRFNAKADAGHIHSWQASAPDSGLASLMFVNDAQGFILLLQKARKLIVEPSFYQHGRAQFIFEPAGLRKQFRY